MDQLARAKEMRRNGLRWGTIERLLGTDIEKFRRVLEPEFRERRAARIKAAKAARCGEEGRASRLHQARHVDASEVARALQSVPKDTRDPVARHFGDPLPGRSAWDRRSA